MAIEAEVEDGAGEAGKAGGKSKKKLVIIGLAALIAVLAIGGGLYAVLGIGKPAPVKSVQTLAVPQSFIFNLPEMMVNLNTAGKGTSFMKLSIALEVANKAMMAEIQPRMAEITDAFQVYLRELRPSDLQGSAGIYRLKEELLRRVNIAIAPAHVEAILFKQILVQ